MDEQKATYHLCILCAVYWMVLKTNSVHLNREMVFIFFWVELSLSIYFHFKLEKNISNKSIMVISGFPRGTLVKLK